MENASKALIIAGAILISILLISVGIMVMNSTDSVTGEVAGKMDAQAIQMFNKEFESYIGENIRGSQVRSLLTSINASNASNPDKVITVSYDSSTDIDTITGKIKATLKYNVSQTTDKSGLIKEIQISNAS